MFFSKKGLMVSYDNVIVHFIEISKKKLMTVSNEPIVFYNLLPHLHFSLLPN